MRFKKIIRHFYLSFFGRLKSIKPGVHILNSHFVTPNIYNYEKDYKTFENFLNYLSEKTNFLTLPEAVNKINSGYKTNGKPYIAFTFDDGFEECYTVIAPLLEKFKTRGAFFINPNYINSSNEYQNNFNKRILLETKKPMNWEQILDLHNRGHLIGSHNLDHTNMATLSESDLLYQLRESKTILEQKLNYSCDYFAWTYGQMKHFPEKAKELTLKYHKFIFSGTNYKCYKTNGNIINRRHIEPFWLKSHINFFLSINKK